MEIKNYIWDFDGTLYDSYPAMVEGAAKGFKILESSKIPERFYQTMKKFSTRQLREEYQLEEEEFTSVFHQYERESSFETTTICGN